MRAFRLIGLAALVGLGYGVLSRAGLAVIDDTNEVALLWPASGFALAVFVSTDRRRWPLLAAAILLGNLVAQFDARGLGGLSLALAATNALEPVLVAGVLRAVYRQPGFSFGSVRAVSGLVLAATAGNAVTALLGALALWVGTGAAFGSSWTTWWLADGLGILVVAPALIAFAARPGEPRAAGWRSVHNAEALAVILVTVALSGGIFLQPSRDALPALHYVFLLFPVLLWAAMRTGPRAITTTLAIVGIVGALGTTEHLGPFARPDLDPAAGLLVFQLFVAVSVVGTLLIAAVIAERRVAVERLAAEREQFASVLRAATEFSVIGTDLDGTITVFNVGAEQMLGYTADELIGHATPELFHVEHEVVARAGELEMAPGFGVFVVAAGSGQAETREWTYRRKDGGLVPVSLTVTAIVGDDGAVTGHIGIAQDIGDRKRAEHALRDSERRHRLVVQNMPDVVIALVDRGLRCELLEGGKLDRQGFSRKAFEGYPLADNLPPERFAQLAHEYTAALGGEHRSLEYTTTGNRRHYEVEIAPVVDDQGQVTHALSVSRDVTERWTAEQALRAAQEQFRGAFEHAPIGMALIDPGGRFVKVNEAFGAVTGYGRDELQAMTLSAITDPAHVADADAGFAALRSGERETHVAETRYLHADGHPVEISARSSMVRDADGEPFHYLVQAVDITERKRLERQLQYMANHDPLTGLLNRRRFEAELDPHAAECARNGPVGALIVLDIDRFKQVNDTLGHAAGDALIISVAEVLRNLLRTTDQLARLGGDELVILLPRATREEAAGTAQRLLEGVRSWAADTGIDQLRAITISVGVAMFDDADADGEHDVIAAADRAMYDAKQAGGDRYAFWSAADSATGGVSA